MGSRLCPTQIGQIRPWPHEHTGGGRSGCSHASWVVPAWQVAHWNAWGAWHGGIWVARVSPSGSGASVRLDLVSWASAPRAVVVRSTVARRLRLGFPRIWAWRLCAAGRLLSVLSLGWVWLRLRLRFLLECLLRFERPRDRDRDWARLRLGCWDRFGLCTGCLGRGSTTCSGPFRAAAAPASGFGVWWRSDWLRADGGSGLALVLLLSMLL